MKNISSLLSYLKNTQLSDGSFEHSPFQTSLILVLLEPCKNTPVVQRIARQAINYLLSQSSVHKSWNYWDRSHPKSVELPDDLDDTTMILTAITIHEHSLIDETLLLSFIKLLIMNETREGGPYFTWIVPPHIRESWNDIDLGVNSTIHHFLDLQKINLTPLDAYLTHTIETQQFSSKYYSPLHIIYFLSRWKECSHKKLLMNYLVQEYPKVTTLLDRSLFVTAYLNLGGNPKKISHEISRLSRIQSQHLAADPFYIESIENGMPVYAGSPSLTAASIIHTLSKSASVNQQKSRMYPNTTSLALRQVSRLALRRFSHMPKDIQHDLRKLIEKMGSHKKSSEVFLLPLMWHESLGKKHSREFSQDQLVTLCVANVLGWIGFGIYDDVIDGEQKQAFIPLANICVREVSEIFNTITSDSPDYRTVKNTLQGIDRALFWERKHCHVSIINNILELPENLPSYGNLHHLAHKSFGHALGPILITQSKKHYVRDFFLHYLVARQLNDDAHDWLTDLQKGFINPVASQILHRLRQLYPGQRHINLVTEKELLQSLFWYEIIDIAAQTIAGHLDHAKIAMKKLGITKNTSISTELILPLEQSCRNAITERDRMVKFLERYH